MKTCKTGCGKMKAGGSVKKVKKMANGGQALNKAKGFAPAQKGGTAKSSGCPPGWYKSGSDCFPSNKPFYSTGSKIGVGSIIAGTIGTGIKKMVDKRKAKKDADAAAKKAIMERAESKPKGKFGMSVAVKSSCKQGMVRGADGNCVMSRPKFKSGGSLKPVNKSANPGLAKLPTAVRNNMGYMKKGGVKKR